jgi:hypothetical protein
MRWPASASCEATPALERVVKRLDDRQYLREVGLAGRHDGRGCELAVADAECELDGNGFLRLLGHS